MNDQGLFTGEGFYICFYYKYLIELLTFESSETSILCQETWFRAVFDQNQPRETFIYSGTPV